ncbi:MAG: peroxiredoxin [Synechococcaceae cyanobacterium]|nr:peroxiredoxin [Synechococcaceae cyanobacterium]
MCALLSAALLILVILLLEPQQASAIGGVLPALDQPAPTFVLPGVAPAAAPPSGGEAGSRSGLALQSSSIKEVTLSLDDFQGQWLVLYFYPRDFTSGCTLEARGFQRDLEQFSRLGASVVGISADDSSEHASFCGSEGLHFPLLSDPDGSVSRRYGSWIAPFSQRHTFLIDPKGFVRARWSAVRPTGHSREVLAELEHLQQGAATGAIGGSSA